MAQEYLLTNKLGAYSSAHTSLGNTRKYHGLLVAALPGLERVMFFNRLLETLGLPGEQIQLGQNYFGQESESFLSKYKWILSDLTGGSAEWKIDLSDRGIVVTKRLQISPISKEVEVTYKITGNDLARLMVRPALGNRSMHAVRRYQRLDLETFSTRDEAGLLKISIGGYDLTILHSGWEFSLQPDFYYNFFYPVEKSRGYEALEDLYVPGVLTSPQLAEKNEYRLVFSLSEREEIRESLISSTQLTSSYYKEHQITPSKLSSILLRQAQQFIVEVEGQPSVIAGYHWFGDWGRDTFISFKGLFLLTGRFEEAKRLLLRWNQLFVGGLLPNRPMEKDYNSVDAVFWYAVAVWEYWLATKDQQTVASILPKLVSIYWAFASDAKSKLQVDRQGLLLDQNVGKSPTWMDAKIGDYVVTDRSGWAVEIQLLWYNYLRIVINLKTSLGLNSDLEVFHATSEKVRQHFLAKFWWNSEECLYDVIKPVDNNTTPSDTIRPNQIMGLYLPFSSELVPADKAMKVIETVQKHLLTDMGLRTLQPGHADYRAHYSGSQEERDMAYHQGTVWPFLLGHYLVVYMRTYKFNEAARAYARAALKALMAELEKQDLAYVPEIADATTLRADGCISQAWSAATLLEAYTLAYTQE